MIKGKGFTLIELLAVIVILAIIALITIPLILGVVDTVQKEAYKRSLSGIFKATDLYLATDNFKTFPSGGINVNDPNIQLKNKSFISGKVIENDQGELELERVSNGVYCGNGTLENLTVIKGSCDQLDTTPPTDVTIGSNTVTSNSITIVAGAIDNESGIGGYQFSNDNGASWTSIRTSNVYTFTGLTNNTSYTFKIRAINNNDLITESDSILVTTNDIPLPNYSVDTTNWSQSKIVTITYPSREQGYVYEYSLDNASTWEEVTSPATTKDITFTSNGSVIARITDGTNVISGAVYDVANIDTTSPVITSITTSVINTTSKGFTIIRTGDAIDDESGLLPNPYDYQISSDGSNWITKCNNNSTSCSINDLYEDTNYYYRVCVTDNAGNKACSSRDTVATLISYYDDIKGVNYPRLVNGLTPIKWNGSTWIETTEDDPEWYDYNNKQWANAKTADGSMWVWIPRYIYKISSGWHTSSAGTIDVQFSIDIDDTIGGSVILDTGTTSNASNNKWTNHPAFKFGDTELTGIWVAKFEPSGTIDSIDIKPGVSSLRGKNVNVAFTACRNMETNAKYGWGTSGSGIDTHIVKSIEWGAIAYLAKSNYGKVNEIATNTSSSFYTGGGTGTAYISNVAQSTTGNIYGIYDINGGAYEHSASYVDNGNIKLSYYGTDVIDADIKYRDVYSVTSDTDASNYANAINKKGNAVYETSSSYERYNSWFNDYSLMPYGTNPWFQFSGYYGYQTQAGAFHFTHGTGYGGSSMSWRIILLVENNL